MVSSSSSNAAGSAEAGFAIATTQVAAVVLQGQPDNFQQGHAALLAWLEANRYHLAGPYREIYLYTDSRAESATEIQYPVEKD